jgi:hypothetical protein
MPIRTKSQKIGAQGQRFVQLLIETNGDWIVRGQEEDFGIDLEAELTEEGVKGHIIKLQVKSSECIKVAGNVIPHNIPTSIIRYANTCRIPVILIIVSVNENKAWYLWLQKWIVELRQSGKYIEDLSKSVTVHIPSSQTLEVGLKDDLKQVARCATDTQLVLNIADTLRTAAAVRSQTIMATLSQLLTDIEKSYKDYPVEIVVDEVLNLGPRIWATREGNEVSQILFELCRNHGDRFNSKQILRLILRGVAVSRTGIIALGILYDKYPDHTSKLNLPELFKDHDDQRARYYCRLREKYLGKTLLEVVNEGKDVRIDNFTFSTEDYLDKWPNRGESAFIDYVYTL